MGKSIGIIETHGMVAAYEGVDAALKAASVVLVSKQLADAGLVTMTFEGDVASVQAAVEAAVASVKRMGRPVVGHVIPRLSDEVLDIIEWDQLKEKPQEPNAPSCDINQEVKAVLEELDEEIEAIENGDFESAEEMLEPETETENSNDEISETEGRASDSVSFGGKNYNVFKKGGIDRLKVVQLRQLARELKIDSMDRSKIKFANKTELLSAIRKHMRGGDGR
jgi:microcompartment protein CcmL/EutN